MSRSNPYQTLPLITIHKALYFQSEILAVLARKLLMDRFPLFRSFPYVECLQLQLHLQVPMIQRNWVDTVKHHHVQANILNLSSFGISGFAIQFHGMECDRVASPSV